MHDCPKMFELSDSESCWLIMINLIIRRNSCDTRKLSNQSHLLDIRTPATIDRHEWCCTVKFGTYTNTRTHRFTHRHIAHGQNEQSLTAHLGTVFLWLNIFGIRLINGENLAESIILNVYNSFLRLSFKNHWLNVSAANKNMN